MRITNGIMINSCLFNINKNKLQVDKINQQIDSTKLFQKPSEDPIAAIRSLRLRSTQNEINQYLTNVGDAKAWLEITQTAMESLETVIGNTELADGIISYLTGGVSEYQEIEDREKIISTLKTFRDAVYADGNADNGDRTIFTGYRTDSTLTFMTDTDDQYKITENVTLSNFRHVDKVSQGVNPADLTSTQQYNGTMIHEQQSLHVIMLGYDGLDTGQTPEVTLNGTALNVIVRTKDQYPTPEMIYSYDATVNGNDVIFLPETGELIFGDTLYDSMNKNDIISATYTKTGFVKGDLKPEHYFYCEKTTTLGTVQQTKIYGTEKTINGQQCKVVEDQEIEYNINFNQSVKVNVLGKDILPPSLGRDLDILIMAAETAVEAHRKQEAIEKKIAQEEASESVNTAEVNRLKGMLEAAKLETSYAESNLTKAFSNGITLYQEHSSQLATQIADVGSRLKRIDLNESRLNSQQLTVQSLLSQNEDTNLESAAVEFNEAMDVFEASLKIAVQIVQKSLLDYI